MASNISNNNNNIKLELEFLIVYDEWFQDIPRIFEYSLSEEHAEYRVQTKKINRHIVSKCSK